MNILNDQEQAPYDYSIDGPCCDACGAAIQSGQRYHRAHDSDLCANCAPSYQDMLDATEKFIDGNEDPRTPEMARSIVDAHLERGGKITDAILNAAFSYPINLIPSSPEASK